MREKMPNKFTSVIMRETRVSGPVPSFFVENWPKFDDRVFEGKRDFLVLFQACFFENWYNLYLSFMVYLYNHSKVRVSFQL